MCFRQQTIQIGSMNSPQICKLLLANIFEEPIATSKLNCNSMKCVQISVKHQII